MVVVLVIDPLQTAVVDNPHNDDMNDQGLSQAAPLRQSRTAIGIVPLKNGQGDNLSPSKFREKNSKGSTHEEKLQAETERGKHILSHL